MSLRIKRIDPCSGSLHQYVTLTGTLLGTRHILWGDRVLEEGEWKGEVFAPGDVTLTFTIPQGSGTVSVVAIDGEERSNTVHFTYIRPPVQPDGAETPAPLLDGEPSVFDELVSCVRGAPRELVDRLEESDDARMARLGRAMRSVRGQLPPGPDGSDRSSLTGDGPTVIDPVTHDPAW
ncbi:hypothetical protein Q5762_01215 [Streptomyces sp. P9(2023)]|uniref:hypothetical protein n=1 Tax=Streptomyces sp. P9(2023) TaxID=3064394 RepID=UPI0028F44DDF|nr:hypothetical protein [Streptomyces sp. P9(2023)]MDT9686989.1 hypothetical protein [Streptomyces sp. P9(2023)]